MRSVHKLVALSALLGVFYLSVSHRYGEPGWQIQFSPAPAEARSETKDYDLHDLAILNRAVIHIKENYVDPARINERKMLAAALERAQTRVAELLVDIERDGEKLPSSIGVRIYRAQRVFDLTDVTNLWQMSFKFKDIFRFIEANLKHHEDLRDVEYAAINGMLSTLDPHSVLMRPEQYREMKLSTRGKFGGLGIVINVRDGQLTIVNPIEDTPAARAGLKAGDKVVQIGLDSTVNMSLNDAVGLLRGAPNTKVDVWILRDGWTKPRKFTITRANIKVKSVNSRVLDDGVLWVRIRNFQNTTRDELERAIKDHLKGSKKRASKGLILDLRSNPGGLLDQAIKVADLFVRSGPLVTTVGFGDKMREPKMATRAGTYKKMPIVVLIDPSSASASEIVAGALKNHHRALLVGQRSFGKGSVQSIYDNKDGSALKLTIAQYLTPGDLSIQSVGITPDVGVKPLVVSAKETNLFYDESSGEGRLPAHLDHESTATTTHEAPQVELSYLLDEALEERIAENPNQMLVDFEVELAQSLLKETQASNMRDMLNAVRPVLESHRGQQMSKLRDALAERGVTWSPPRKTPTGRPQAKINVEMEPASPVVTAGETLNITLMVTNHGDGPFSRLYALSKSDNAELDGLEFVFGDIPPGETRRWNIPVETPKSSLRRRDTVQFVFHEAHDRAPPPVEAVVEMTQLPRPRFAFDYRIDDREWGNADGLLQLGEEAELSVTVQNVGVGEAYALVAYLRNDESDPERRIFIKRGRVEGGGLAAGGQTTFRFRFKVKAEAPGQIPLWLGVYDNDLDDGTSEKLQLEVVGPDQGVSVIETVLSPREGSHIPIYTHPVADAPTVARAEGPVVARGRIEGWYRVLTDEGLYGWVPEGQTATGSQATPSGKMRALVPSGPPQIKLDRPAPALSTTAGKMTVGGTVLGDRPIKDLRVFVNRKKVFFKSSAGVAASKLDFTTSVALDEGLNRIDVVARQRDETATSKTLLIHRETAP